MLARVFLLLACDLVLSAQAAGRHEAASATSYAGPALAILQVKPPSLWQERRGLILGIFAVVAVQSALIAGLLVNRATRRRAERALAESEERMSLAAESANLGLWVWDIVRDEFWVTPRFRSMFGFRPNEVITFAVFRVRVHPEDREAMERQVRSALAEKQSLRVAIPPGPARWRHALDRRGGSRGIRGFRRGLADARRLPRHHGAAAGAVGDAAIAARDCACRSRLDDGAAGLGARARDQSAAWRDPAQCRGGGALHAE